MSFHVVITNCLHLFHQLGFVFVIFHKVANPPIYTLLISRGAILNFKSMTSFADRFQPPSLHDLFARGQHGALELRGKLCRTARCSCAGVCFDILSRGLVCFIIISICNRNITCLVRNLFPGFIPAFLRRYPWLYNIESRFTQMQEERVKVLVELSRTTFQVCRHKG